MARKIKQAQQALMVVMTSFFAIAFAVPVFITFTSSFMTTFEIAGRYGLAILPQNYFYRLDTFPNINFVRMTAIPGRVTLRQYIELFQNAAYMIGLWNSITITAPSVVGQLVLAVPAAYALEFCKWRHKEKLFFVYIVVMLMPLTVVLVPQFIITGYMGIQESPLAIILPAVASPFAVFVLRQFAKNIPVEYLEAAKIDGAGHLRIMISIISPLLKPAIAALALLAFIDYWNVVDQAIVFITDPEFMPLSVGLMWLRGSDIVYAASFFFMIPALLVFMIGQEHLVEGMRMSVLR